jgi:hypothetical protein
MNYKKPPYLTLLVLLVGMITFFTTDKVNAHKVLKNGKMVEHDPITCKLEADRKWWERFACKDATKRHKLCKLDQYCAILKLEEQQKQIDILVGKIEDATPVDCNSLTFSHVALNNASIYQKPSGNSKVIKKVKKGQKISFVGSTEKKGWIIVVPKDKLCTVGYINEKNIGLSTASGSSTSANPKPPKIKKDKNIKITFPKWKKAGELITLDQSGFFEIDGYVNKDLGINKIIINYDGNDEEMILGSDGSFNASLEIENTLDVRITTYKNSTQIGKALVFKVTVE